MQLIKRNNAFAGFRKSRVRGISLLEVLVSVLLSAIGLLALAGANVASIRYSKMSQYRGTATLLATDFAERVRANKAGLANYAVGDDFATQTTAPSASTACETYAATCSVANLASYDLTQWRRQVRAQLPSGSVFISIPGGQSALDVWIAWQDPSVAAPDENSADARNNAKECPNGLSVGTDRSIRCSYFRINI
jgi:type IV pilus assembly protein PilV